MTWATRAGAWNCCAAAARGRSVGTVVWRPALERLDLDDAGAELDEQEVDVETVTLRARRRAR